MMYSLHMSGDSDSDWGSDAGKLFTCVGYLKWQTENVVLSCMTVLATPADKRFLLSNSMFEKTT